MTRNRYFLVCLAFFLLFAQQGAVLHALTHIPDELRLSQRQDQHPAQADTCQLCLAYAAVGAGLLPATLLIATSDILITYVVEAQSSAPGQPFLAYLSRAPPRLV